MKYRTSFVTNSSSSSFICDVCGNSESGWDMGLSDAGMYECENGHTFCDSHLVAQPEPKETDSDNEDDEDEDDRYEVKAARCPICSFKMLYHKDALKFLMNKFNMNDSKILEEMKQSYATYEEFKKDLK
jgi:hypothetical protein